MANSSNPEQIAAHAQSLRSAIRNGSWRAPTAGAAPGALQANLAIVPAAVADAFEAFCHANPRPCPLLARGAPGERALPSLGKDIDIVSDVPAYRVFRDGARAERIETLADLWREDLTVFALGCSFSFEAALDYAGVPLPHAAASGGDVSMYVTNRATTPVDPFRGELVVSMRPIPRAQLDQVRAVTAAYPHAHGAPVHEGDPAEIGIEDLERPDFGAPPQPVPDSVPVFWACGVTPQRALLAAGLDLAITHEPSHMLVTDLDAADPALARRFGFTPEPIAQ